MNLMRTMILFIHRHINENLHNEQTEEVRETFSWSNRIKSNILFCFEAVASMIEIEVENFEKKIKRKEKKKIRCFPVFLTFDFYSFCPTRKEIWHVSCQNGTISNETTTIENNIDRNQKFCQGKLFCCDVKIIWREKNFRLTKKFLNSKLSFWFPLLTPLKSHFSLSLSKVIDLFHQSMNKNVRYLNELVILNDFSSSSSSSPPVVY